MTTKQARKVYAYILDNTKGPGDALETISGMLAGFMETHYGTSQCFTERLFDLCNEYVEIRLKEIEDEEWGDE